jgi:anti-sigma-K factor RskA
MSAIAAGLLGLLVLRPDPAPPVSQPVPVAAPAPLIAVLTPTEGDAKPVAAVFEPGTGEVRLAGAVTIPARRAAELWAIGADATPRSLGVLSAGDAPRLTIAAARRAQLARGVPLAISVEPLGGSPTGSPTGPVIATGALTTV